MSMTDQFLLALQTYRELQTELEPDDQPRQIILEVPQVEAGSVQSQDIPDGSLLLGLAEDGLPLMLDLYDPTPGSILVAGDSGSGKTALLQSLARAAEIGDPGEIQYCVLTAFPEEWSEVETLPGCMGIWPFDHPSSSEMLTRLINWSEVLPETRQVVLLLLDGLERAHGARLDFQNDLRWLLAHGPERQVWPVVSVNAGLLPRLTTWLDCFHSRVAGHIKHSSLSHLLLGETEANPAALLPGVQYGLNSAGSWLKFNLPSLD